MPVPPATYVSDLDPTRPDGAVEPISEGDDWIRRLHAVLRNTFPTMSGPVLATPEQLNQLAGPPLVERFLEKQAAVPAAWIASQEEAEAGENNGKVMTPLRTAQVLDGRFGSGVLRVPVVTALPAGKPAGSLVWKDGLFGFSGTSWVEFAPKQTPWEATASVPPTDTRQLIEATHGFGALPSRVLVTLRCTSAEHGYEVGEEVQIESARTGDGSIAATVFFSATKVGVVMGRPRLLSKASLGDAVALTASKWTLVFRAWR